MKARRVKWWAALAVTLPLTLLVQTTPSIAQTLCGAPEVKMGTNHIQVAPTGVDDTTNIQCALDLAVEQRIPEIRLTRGDFFIGTLSAQGFSGTLQGGGQDHTRLRLLAQSVACDASEASGEETAAIKFIGGEPRLRWLTLIAEPNVWPCSQGTWYGIGAMVHFTGHRGSVSECAADVVYGTIDRVTFEGPRNYDIGPQEVSAGVLARAESTADPNCRRNLLGTVRINRSRISGFRTGAWLDMRGNAQISVLNTDFDGNHTGLRVDDSNAVVTVFGNRFASKAPGSYSCCQSGGTGIGVFNHVVSTGATHLDVYGNTFDIQSGGFDQSEGIRLTRNPGATAMRLAVSGNHFQLSGGGNLAVAVSSHGVSGGVLSDNLFSSYLQGSGLALYVNSEVMGEAEHWTFVGNRGLADMYTPDIVDVAHVFLGGNSSDALIGPGQAAIVRDEGLNNIILPQ